MYRKRKYLTERGNERLRNIINDGRIDQPATIDDLSLAIPLLGKATADVESLAIGTFNLQKGKPATLDTGSDTREAYALAAISEGDLVTIQYMIGEDSRGYWAALPLTATPADPVDPTDPEPSCICQLVDVLEKMVESLSDELTDDETEEIEELIQTAKTCGGCTPDPITCNLCAEGELAQEIEVQLSGFEFVAWPDDPDFPFISEWPKFDQWSVNLVAAINKTHRLTMECGGASTTFTTTGEDRHGVREFTHRIELSGPQGSTGASSFPDTWVVTVTINEGDNGIATFGQRIRLYGEDKDKKCAETYEDFTIADNAEIFGPLSRQPYVYINPSNYFVRVKPVT